MSEYSSYLNGNINTGIFPRRFSNQIYFSDYAKFYLKYKSVYSIKYPITGEDNYKLNNRTIELRKNNYLVVNNEQDVECLLGNSEKAISIFVDPELMTDVFNTCRKNNEELLSNPFDIKNNVPMFFENSYPLKDNPLSRLLRNFSTSFDEEKRNSGMYGINFFFKVSEAMIISQQETFRQIKRIDSIKKSTKSELYSRMLKAKEYINDNWRENISLTFLARLVHMSPYHFHRIFSTVFKTTPQQYHKLLRMWMAGELLKNRSHRIAEIAILTGYENVHSFSKAFKKHFGVSPSNITTN